MNYVVIFENFLLIVTWIFLLFGIVGLFRFPTIYGKLLNSSKIDTVTVICLIAALIVINGFNVGSLKLVVILLFILLTNPVTNHLVALSAYKNRIDLPKEK